MIIFLAASGAQGVTMSICPAQTKALNLHLSLRSVSGQSQGCLRFVPGLTYFVLQTEPKILRLVLS